MMDEKMKEYFRAWFNEYKKKEDSFPDAIDGAEWVIDYLRSRQEPVATAEEERIVEHTNLAPGTDLYAEPKPAKEK